MLLWLRRWLLLLLRLSSSPLKGTGDQHSSHLRSSLSLCPDQGLPAVTTATLQAHPRLGVEKLEDHLATFTGHSSRRERHIVNCGEWTQLKCTAVCTGFTSTSTLVIRYSRLPQYSYHKGSVKIKIANFFVSLTSNYTNSGAILSESLDLLW